MRARWVALCCVFMAANNVQAEPYRSWDRDDSFNPLDAMREMPNPMGVFDSADRRRSERRRMRPPIHRPPPPLPGYPAPYAYPPVVRPSPYGVHPYSPAQSQPSASGRQAVDSPAQENQNPPSNPMTEHQQSAAPSVPGVQQPATPYPENQQSGYNFRPVAPPEQNAPEAAPLPETPAEPMPLERAQQPPSPAPAPPSGSQQTPMINGKPAVFRPMELGVEDLESK